MLRQKDGGYFCGGTLIDPLWVLTAAHCVFQTKASEIFVRMGAHYKEKGTVGTEQNIDVVKIIVHENFNAPLQLSNDLALMKLERPAKLTEAVGLACLPDFNNSLVNKTCWITGWGKLSDRGPDPEVLMQAAVPLVSHQRCREAYPREVDNSMMCAGPEQGGVDSCEGDSGGPLVCEFNDKWFLEGVTSWGDGCAEPGKFGVYADVRVFKSWINARINSSSASTAAASVEASPPSASPAISMLSQTSSPAEITSTLNNGIASAAMATASSSHRSMASSGFLKIKASVSQLVSISSNEKAKA